MASNKKIDKITGVTNIILGIFYVFLSLFSFFGGMVIELTIDATNRVYITLIKISSWLFLLNYFISLGAIPVALIFKRKGHSLLSLFISLLPLMILLLAFVFLAVADHIPSVV